MPPTTAPSMLDRQCLCSGGATSPRMNASASSSRVRMRDRRNPVRDLRVVAAGDHRVDVVLRPRAQHEVAVTELHDDECMNRRAVVGARRCGRDSGRLQALYDCAFRKPALAGFLNCGKTGRRPTLPGACAPSTIGAGGLNFSVRNGKRCIPAAMTAQIVEGPAAVSHRARTHPQNSIAAVVGVQNQDLGQLVRLR